MNKVAEGFQKVIDNIAKAPHQLTADEKQSEIAAILQGFTREEVKALSTKTQELEMQSRSDPNGLRSANLMEVAHHMLTYPRQSTNTIDTEATPPIPAPADPATNPGAIRQEDEPDFGTPLPRGKKHIFTRGQKIKSDVHDYEKEYPRDGTLDTEKNVAARILCDRIGLTDSDKDAITAMQQRGASFDQIAEHLATRIKAQRRVVEEKKQEWQYNQILDECYVYIPKYLKETLGGDTAGNLNALPDKGRVHIVGDYDFISVAGSGSKAIGVFRSQNGDVYVGQSYLQQFEKSAPIGSDTIGEFPRLYWEMKAVIIHELLHSMSVLNYVGKDKDDKENVQTRRVGLKHTNYTKRAVRGVGVNEGTTEHLSQEILRYLYEQEGLNNYRAPWTAYHKEQEIMDTMVLDTDIDVTWDDFYKGMLLRKKASPLGPNRIGPTPLVDLIAKVNGGREILKQKRPYFFDIIMYLMDYVNESGVNIDFVLEFITKKDISIVTQHLGSTLSAIIPDRTLLNESKSGFNEFITNAYSPSV